MLRQLCRQSTSQHRHRRRTASYAYLLRTAFEIGIALAREIYVAAGEVASKRNLKTEVAEFLIPCAAFASAQAAIIYKADRVTVYVAKHVV